MLVDRDSCELNWKYFVQVFKHYFEELEEESLRDNFVVVVSSLGLNCNAVIIPIFTSIPALSIKVVILCTLP